MYLLTYILYLYFIKKYSIYPTLTIIIKINKKSHSRSEIFYVKFRIILPMINRLYSHEINYFSTKKLFISSNSAVLYSKD